MNGTLSGVWRDLRCTVCGNDTGFTREDLPQIMDKSYVMKYWCDRCNQHQVNEFTGAAYELVNNERIYTELNFEG